MQKYLKIENKKWKKKYSLPLYGSDVIHPLSPVGRMTFLFCSMFKCCFAFSCGELVEQCFGFGFGVLLARLQWREITESIGRRLFSTSRSHPLFAD